MIVLSSARPTVASRASFINPYSCFVFWRRRRAHPRLSFYSDGFLLSAILTLASRKRIARASFDDTSLAIPLLDAANANRNRLYVVGSTSPMLSRFLNLISVRYPHILICGYSHGYLSSDEWPDLYSSIRSCKADLVLIGLGSGRQEDFLEGLIASGFAGAAYTCGGYIHQTARSKGGSYYPRWVNRLGLRFAYRMLREPYTIPRYVAAYPVGLVLAIVWYIRGDLVVR